MLSSDYETKVKINKKEFLNCIVQRYHLHFVSVDFEKFSCHQFIVVVVRDGENLDRATLLVKEGDKKPIIINIKDETMELKINSILGVEKLTGRMR